MLRMTPSQQFKARSVVIALAALLLAFTLAACGSTGSPASGANTNSPATNSNNSTQTQSQQNQSSPSNSNTNSSTSTSSSTSTNTTSSSLQNTDQQVQGLMKQLDGSQSDVHNADSGSAQDSSQP